MDYIKYVNIKQGSKSLHRFSQGNTLPLVLCSTLAILGKNIVAKAGAIGIGCCLAYNIARNGFGLGKEHPMR